MRSSAAACARDLVAHHCRPGLLAQGLGSLGLGTKARALCMVAGQGNDSGYRREISAQDHYWH